MLALARRALSGLAVVLGVVTLMFALLRLAPGDPALLLVGPAASAEQVAAQRHALGLDRPLPAQYAAWLGRFARGRLGHQHRHRPAGPRDARRRRGPRRCGWSASRWC